MSKKCWNALIIDDERLARKDLMALLASYSDIKIVGEAEDVPSAADAVDRLKPDLIFLDIQMPGESGFDLLDRIESEAKIIFVTAFDEYAIRAFEVNAVDYLLKPVNPARLRKTIQKLSEDQSAEPQSARKLNYDDRMFLMLGRHFRFLKMEQIVGISAAGDYSEVSLSNREKALTLKSMKEWERRLPEKHFVRIHRSTILNLEYIDRVEEWFNYSFRVYVKGRDEPFVMSRRYAARLKERMG